MVSRPVPADRVARFTAGLIEDLVLDGWAQQWRKRVERFEACRVRPGDFLGRCPRETAAERDRRLDAVTLACWNRAAAIELERAW